MVGERPPNSSLPASYPFGVYLTKPVTVNTDTKRPEACPQAALYAGALAAPLSRRPPNSDVCRNYQASGSEISFNMEKTRTYYTDICPKNQPTPIGPY